MGTTWRLRMVGLAQTYTKLYHTMISRRIMQDQNFILQGPQELEMTRASQADEAILVDLHSDIRSLLDQIPLPEKYLSVLDMRAANSGALTIKVYNERGAFDGEIYIKTNGGIRFSEPRSPHLNEMAIMEAIDGAPRNRA